MIPYFDAHCDTIYRCLETGETSALEYGEDREEQRRYYAASTHLRKNGGHIDLERGTEVPALCPVFRPVPRRGGGSG